MSPWFGGAQRCQAPGGVQPPPRWPLGCYLLINHTPPPLNRGQASIRGGVLGPICRKTPPGTGTRLGGAGVGALGVPNGDKTGTKRGQRRPRMPQNGLSVAGHPKGLAGGPGLLPKPQTPKPCPPWAVGWWRWCPRSPPVLQRRRRALLSAGTKEPKRGRYRANKRGERPGGAAVGWQLHGVAPTPSPSWGWQGAPRAPRCHPCVCQCAGPHGVPPPLGLGSGRKSSSRN